LAGWWVGQSVNRMVGRLRTHSGGHHTQFAPITSFLLTARIYCPYPPYPGTWRATREIRYDAPLLTLFIFRAIWFAISPSQWFLTWGFYSKLNNCNTPPRLRSNAEIDGTTSVRLVVSRTAPLQPNASSCATTA